MDCLDMTYKTCFLAAAQPVIFFLLPSPFDDFLAIFMKLELTTLNSLFERGGYHNL